MNKGLFMIQEIFNHVQSKVNKLSNEEIIILRELSNIINANETQRSQTNADIVRRMREFIKITKEGAKMLRTSTISYLKNNSQLYAFISELSVDELNMINDMFTITSELLYAAGTEIVLYNNLVATIKYIVDDMLDDTSILQQ